MSAAFLVAVVAYALGVAVVCAFTALRGRRRHPLILPALLVIEFCVLVQAVLDLVHLAGGPRPAALAVHIGYLAASVVILPLAVGSVRLDEGRWATAAVGIGCVIVAVVSLRLHQTLDPAGSGARR